MLTPAYAMNPHNMGHEERACKCGATFQCYKTSRRNRCDECYENDGDAFCRPCAGTGQYITGVTNEVPTGPGGECYRCGGKGYQDPRDMRRNDYYDRHRPVSI